MKKVLHDIKISLLFVFSKLFGEKEIKDMLSIRPQFIIETKKSIVA